MQLKHRAALGGVQLDSVDDRIMIQRIEPSEGKENISTVSLMGGSGSRVTGIHRDSLDIAVKFTIRLQKRSMTDREEVLEKANAWALNGGWLTTNYKTNRRIRVFRAQAAGGADPWDWTKEFTILLRACGVPYWQEVSGTEVTKTATHSETITMDVHGSEKTVLEATFKNTSGSTVNTFSLSTPEASMAFTDLGLENGETLSIDHSDNGKRNVLRIRIQSTGGTWRSAMDKRTAASNNELTITPGSRSVVMSAGGNGTLKVSCRGRFA